MLSIWRTSETNKDVTSTEPAQPFVLTPEEQVYLDSLRTRPIVISYSYDLAQTEFDGKPAGMLEPVLDILRNEFGLTVNLVKSSWHDAFIQVDNREVDFYGPIAISESRRQKYITVDPFYRSHSTVMTRAKDPIHSIRGLYNGTVGLV
jgi:ABC-type amino acid transport substrate-binding protein